MIYLDYAANTPVSKEVLDLYYEESLKALGNPNSKHGVGVAARKRLDEFTQKIAELLGVKENEIIYCSGASEANNLAIKGLAQMNKQNGKHIISTCMEHPSVSGALTYLQAQGFEIDLLDISSEGLVDLDHLEELLRKDTILVSICMVDSELGICQPIDKVAELLKNYPDCRLHTDATQAIGKIPVDFSKVDCASFAPHKFYGLNSCGVLIKKEHIILEPLIHGGSSTSTYRSGTPDLPMVASIWKALSMAIQELDVRLETVKVRLQEIKEGLASYKKVRVNSTAYSTPYIFNLSVQGVKAVQFTQALELGGVCVSVKSACSVLNSPSRPVYAVTKDKKNALCSWRISLSHLTTKEEVGEFFKLFDQSYQQLVG